MQNHLLEYLDECLFTDAYRKQIVSIAIDLSSNPDLRMFNKNYFLFEQIITTFVNIRSFMYSPSKMYHQCLFFDTLPSSLISSTLLELYVYVNTFNQCLYLLDGRFKQLRKFHVQIDIIRDSTVTLDNKVTYYLRFYELFKEIILLIFFLG